MALYYGMSGQSAAWGAPPTPSISSLTSDAVTFVWNPMLAPRAPLGRLRRAAVGVPPRVRLEGEWQARSGQQVGG
jgi:hypothetical protein